MQPRLHPRVRLRLSARLRWSAPLGQQTERCETVNISRGGLLLACGRVHPLGHPLWVTVPFDPAAAGTQVETLARVVRCVEQPPVPQTEPESPLAPPPPRWNIALQFEGVPHGQPQRNGAGKAVVASSGIANGNAVHNGTGRRVSLPIRVRPKHVPWHEETMTVEVSPEKLKFLTNRVYSSGDSLLVSFPAEGEAPWSGSGEWETEVTAVEMESQSDSLWVTVRKKPA